MSDIQKEIKEALEKATPAPWSWRRKNREKNEDDGFFLGELNHWKDDINGLTVLDVHNNRHGFPEISAWSEYDAQLIANAPTWLSHQQELIEQKDAEIARLTEQRNRTLTEWGKTLDDAETLADQLGKEESR